MDGTMAIERGIFWDNYLLRVAPATELLHTLNHATYVWIEHADIDDIFNANWKIGVGDAGHSASPKFFHWESTGPMSWTWGLPQKMDEQHYKDEHDTGYEYGRLTVDCTTSNSMSTQSGSNVIHVSGNSNVKIDSDYGSGSWLAPWAAMYGIHVWLEWNTTITLKAVETGGLQVLIDLNEKNFQVKNDPMSWNGDDGGFGPTKKSVEQRQSVLVDNLKEALKNSALHNVEEKLQNNLNNAARFVVPGLGTFRYKDPFNDNGDLFIQVGYQ